MTYDVHLEIFEGPLDLLLYLIKKNDLEIAEIPIAQITEEYLKCLDMMKDLNLDIAGEFLVMASTLMQIKARMLLPTSETEAEDGPNPLEELKTKLMEYQKFKEVARHLSVQEAESSHIYYRPAPVFEKDDYVLEVSLFDLIGSFSNVLKELPGNVKEIVYKEIPIEQKIREIMDMIEGRQFIAFSEILKCQPTRIDLVVSFLAVLELIRLKQIIARQSAIFDEIRIYRINRDRDGQAGEAELLPPDIPPGTMAVAEQGEQPQPVVELPVEPSASEAPAEAYGETDESIEIIDPAETPAEESGSAAPDISAGPADNDLEDTSKNGNS